MDESKDIKIHFSLTKEDAAGFPIGSEAIWCQAEGTAYRIKNYPFFVPGISFNDLVALAFSGDGYATVVEVINPSDNSTIWINIADDSGSRSIVEALLAVGCGVEGGVFPGYYAINVPKGVDIEHVYSVLDPLIDSGALEANYPAIRHEE